MKTIFVDNINLQVDFVSKEQVVRRDVALIE
jgi:hypothetical protein